MTGFGQVCNLDQNFSSIICQVINCGGRQNSGEYEACLLFLRGE